MKLRLNSFVRRKVIEGMWIMTKILLFSQNKVIWYLLKMLIENTIPGLGKRNRNIRNKCCSFLKYFKGYFWAKNA